MTKISQLDLDKLQELQTLTLGTNHVERWQGTPQTLPYNVSTHAYNCAMLYMQLCFICKKKMSSKLLIALLCHDDMESLTGDLLAPAKNTAPESWDSIEVQIQDQWQRETRMPLSMTKVFLPVEHDFSQLCDEDQYLLKIIDVLEFCLHAQQEYRAGNRCSKVMQGLRYGANSLSHKLSAVQRIFGDKPEVNDYIMDIVTCIRNYYNRQCKDLAFSADYYV